MDWVALGWKLAAVGIVVTTIWYFTKPSVKAADPVKSATVTLSRGRALATVPVDSVCVCTDTTARAAVMCSVTGTMLSVEGNGAAVVAYYCFRR